jgi:hypothetical protein
MMQSIIRRRINFTLLTVSLAIGIGAGNALAQSGSAGGNIGNDDKSLSGTRSAEPERPSRRSRPEAEEPRRSAPRRSGGGGGGGGGGGNFDGAWVVNSVGNPCGSSTTAIVVTSGRIIGDGLSGAVGPSGAASSVGHYGSITVISSGHFSARSGSGTFKRSDGCVGTWAVSKQ